MVMKIKQLSNVLNHNNYLKIIDKYQISVGDELIIDIDGTSPE